MKFAQTAVIFAIFLAGVSEAFCEDAPTKGPDWRVIYNNDGGDLITKGDIPKWLRDAPEDSDPRKELLRRRTGGVLSSGITTISYCTGWAFGNLLHDSKLANNVVAMHKSSSVRTRLAEENTDSLHVMADFCTENDIELWWSMRMNDTHDAANPDLFSDFKRKHPKLMLGTATSHPKYGKWTAVDYAAPEIRNFAKSVIKEVVENYDVKGVELDFFRHPIFFRTTAAGLPASQEEVEMMTKFIAEAHEVSHQAGIKKNKGGKPILLGMRVPDSIEYCRYLGLDLEKILGDKLVDFVIFGGYFRLSNWSYSAELARRHGIPSYASLDTPTVQVPVEPVTQEPSLDNRYGWINGTKDYRRPTILRRVDIESYRGRVLSALVQGQNGVSFFNLFNSRAKIFQDLSNLNTLVKKPVKYFYMSRGTQQPPSNFVPGGTRFYQGPIVNPGFPKALGEKKISLEFSLFLPEIPFQGRARLFLDFSGSEVDGNSRCRLRLNEKELEEIQVGKTTEVWQDLPSKELVTGKNIVEVEGLSDRRLLLRDAMIHVVPEGNEK
jgi:hypothetical protein